MKTLTAVDALKHLRIDVTELEWEKLGDDGRTCLISKPAVLQLIQDWIEYCLDPEKVGK